MAALSQIVDDNNVDSKQPLKCNSEYVHGICGQRTKQYNIVGSSAKMQREESTTNKIII